MEIIQLLLSLAIWGLIFYVLYWAQGKIGVPEPFNKIITVVLVIATVLVLIGLLTGTVAPFPFLTGR